MKRLLLALAAGAAAGWLARELTREHEDNYEIQERELEPGSGCVLISEPLESEGVALDLACKLTEEVGLEFRVGQVYSKDQLAMEAAGEVTH